MIRQTFAYIKAGVLRYDEWLLDQYGIPNDIPRLQGPHEDDKQGEGFKAELAGLLEVVTPHGVTVQVK